MVLLRYLATIIPGVAAFIVFELLFAHPNAVYMLLASWFGIFLATHLFLVGGESRRDVRWQFALPSIALFLSVAIYSLFAESGIARHALAFGTAAFLNMVTWNVYVFLYQPLRYQTNALEYLSHIGNLFTVFFATTSIYGFRLFLGIPAGVVALSVGVLTGLLLQQSFWVSKLGGKNARPYIFLIPFLLVELSVALIALPVIPLVAGAVVTIAYYALLGLARSVLRDAFTPSVGRRYILISMLGIFLLFLTAQWS